MIQIVRLKSDNFDCYMSLNAYHELRLEMSSGDFGVHKTRLITVSPETLETIKYHKKPGFIDLVNVDGEVRWFFYDGEGDCVVESFSHWLEV